MEVHKSAPHSDLPEKAPEPDYAAYKYSMPESPPESYNTGVWYPPANPQSSPAGGHHEPSNGSRRWTRWPLLLLYGLILAVIAGLIGGFVGKAIESNSHQTSAALAGSDACPTTPTTASNPSATPSASASPTSLSPAASASASASPTPASSVFERVIPQPSSGCDASAPYRSFKSRSNILGVPFTTICGQGWMRDDMVAMSVATQSDCIETCSTMNSYVGDGGRKCVGAGFIPEWWDQARAMRESGITPYNCFLKANTSGIARNNEKFEVIALCMGTNCDGISG